MATSCASAAPKRHGPLACKWKHKAHRSAAFDTIDEHIGKLVDLGVVEGV